ncbi:AMP-binding protein [Radicibacter daui]|uniref:AMP-binding protein n=1 Tax=Radicibacter daui TaxID=3064829 RepID=UPI004046A93B
MLQGQLWRPYYPPGVSPDFAGPPVRNIGELVRNAAARYGQRIAYTIVLPNGTEGSLTFAEVDELSDRFAVYLRETLGLAAGERVGVQMPNCLAYPVVAFGIAKAGCVIVNTNPLYTEPEVTRQFNDADVRAAVVINLFADRLHPEKIPGLKHVVLACVSDLLPTLRRYLVSFVMRHVRKQIPVAGFAHTSFLKTLGGDPRKAAAYDEGIELGTLAALQYTGGTTGIAKGAMLSHGNLVSNTLQSFQFMSQPLTWGGEICLTALPVYHIFAFTVNLLGIFHIGGTNILIPSPRPLTNMKAALARYPITLMTGVNTLFAALLNEPWFREAPPRTLKFSVAGGMALHKAVSIRWRELTQSAIIEGYGLTEASPVTHFNPLGSLVKENSIGVPLPGTDCRIVDDEGRDVAAGMPGELLIHGPQVMLGYWRRPDETEKSIRNGWLYTGDVATMDPEGFFHIVDRKKDMIVVSGFNVYPNEVEDCISRLEGVAEVAVIGVPDEATGECVKAFIVRRDQNLTAEMIRDHCRKELTSYKLPKRFEFREELPKSPVGKILRKELRLPAA